MTGALTLGFLDLAPVAELATGAAALVAGDEGWPSAPFAPAMAAPLTGEIELSAERLSAGTFAEARDGRLTLRIARDGVSLADMRAAIFGGTASGIVDFRNDGGTGLLSAQLRIEGADARALLGDAGVDGRADLPPR